MTIVVVLMYAGHGFGRVNNRNARCASRIDHPVIPDRSADGKWRDRCPKATRKSEIINAAMSVKFALSSCLLSQRRFPSTLKFQRLLDIEIPAPAHHQELAFQTHRSLKGFHEIAHQDAVGVNIAKQVGAAQIVPLLKYVVDERSAVFIHGHFSDVTYPVFRDCFRDAFFMAKQNNSALGLQQRPTSDRILLDDGNVPPKRLRYGEQRQHHVITSDGVTRSTQARTRCVAGPTIRRMLEI